MSEISAADVKKLREMTGAGMMDCKSALTEAEGDFEKAIEVLRKKGQKQIQKQAELIDSQFIVIRGLMNNCYKEKELIHREGVQSGGKVI